LADHNILIDTSAFKALLFTDDVNHELAVFQYEQLIDTHSKMFTSNYILLEVSQLAGGIANQTFSNVLRAINGLVTIEYIDKMFHEATVKHYIENPQFGLSLIQWTTKLMSINLKARVFGFEYKLAQSGVLLIP
jgi:predicted nucleic acid-binding protein